MAASLFAPFRCTCAVSQSRSTIIHSTRVWASFSPPSSLSTRPLSRLSPNSMSQPSSAAESTPLTSEDDAVEAQSSDVLVQYVVLRRDLTDTWPVGSVVTQGCHASVSAIWSNKDDPHTLQYCSPENIDSMHKVTLEVKGETQILNLSAKLTAGGIAHKLWIEQPENFPTCLATKPYPKSIVSPYFKKLKLCK
ncbi:Peptidyl-tRNA hydrolase, PTH [Parasponia andersonii]|uniref:peptidyl-tRNA hydrolase n=1 Tax=Parasponia andersonii TaxID=3476 RepID=A0A2P5DID7_PARAD|nr:Peptidyl-tRNA hydrolase, PTH [Parasponia andersonii]